MRIKIITKREKKTMKNNAIEMYYKISDHKTNHTLHLLLSIVTAGFWIWAWCAVAGTNCNKRNKILAEYGQESESNIGSFLFWVIFIINVIVLILLAR